MQTSQRLALPFILPGQSQKELFHNEALQALDTIVAAAVEEGPRNDPPSPAANGSCYIVGSAPTGAWSGRAGNLAAYSSAGWRFVAPTEGLRAWVKSLAVFALYRVGSWEIGTVRGSALNIGGQQVVAARAAAIANPTGGTTIDLPARDAILAILAALRGHGLIAS